jgi:hypothetical protein
VSRGFRAGVWAALAAYFCYFSWDAVRVRFAPDDLMNLDYYWRLRPAEILAALLTPWRGGYRPMGGLFYGPLLRLFGLNPAPYHVLMLALLAVNVWLVYRFARALDAGEAAAFGAAFLACYHAGLSFLYYDTPFIYDALCCVFYLAAFVYYRERRRGGRLSRGQTAVVLGLYWCALNSKEMALTLPAVLAVYEWLYEERRSFRTAIWAAALGLPVLLRSFLGAGALTATAAYRPELSWARIAAFQRAAFGDLFESWNFFTTPWVVAVWVALTAIAWAGRDRTRRFCWWFFVLTPAPIELLQGRGNACLVIPYCGLAVLAATAFTQAAERAAGRRRAVFATVVAAAVCLWAVQNARLKQEQIVPQMRDLGRETWTMIGELQALHPQVRPHSTVIFLNDPFDDYDMAFIADLCFLQRDVNIRLQRKTPIPPGELAKADHLFGYEGGKLTQIR